MKNTTKPPSNRQLKVGEEIRHCLADVFIRGEIFNPRLRGISVTVSEVRVSPDLKNARAYVMPLGGANAEMVVAELEKMAPYFRSVVSAKLTMRYTPRISFQKDDSYEYAGKVEEILNKPEVRRDLVGDEEKK